MTYVYIESEKFEDENGKILPLYTVGFYSPEGMFIEDDDFIDKEEAARRAAFLNGKNR